MKELYAVRIDRMNSHPVKAVTYPEGYDNFGFSPVKYDQAHDEWELGDWKDTFLNTPMPNGVWVRWYQDADGHTATYEFTNEPAEGFINVIPSESYDYPAYVICAAIKTMLCGTLDLPVWITFGHGKADKLLCQFNRAGFVFNSKLSPVRRVDPKR
jgi:hypothetical protein